MVLSQQLDSCSINVDINQMEINVLMCAVGWRIENLCIPKDSDGWICTC